MGQAHRVTQGHRAGAPARSRTSTAAKPRVVACVLSFNNEHDTAECLAGIARLTLPCVATVLVDNGSSDDSGTRLLAAHPQVRGVRLPANIGFTGGANRALAEALALGADYVLFLANDTVPDPGMLEALCAVAEADPRVGLVGPRVMEYAAPDMLQHGAGFLDERTGEVRVADPATTSRCAWVTGCGFLVRAEALRAMQAPLGFDDRFFLYWEDVDFSRRIAAAGYEVVYVPAARLRHKESAQTRQTMSTAKRRSRDYYMLRNRFLFARRHLATGARARMIARAFLAELPRQVLRSIMRERGLSRHETGLILRAYVDGVRGRQGRASYPGLY